ALMVFAIGPTASVVRLLFPMCLLLWGCAVGPSYKRPSVNVPTAFRASSGTDQQVSLADMPWWDLFHDETLKTLVKSSLANNYDLAAAIARVEQARELAAQANSEYFPHLNYLSVTSYGHNQFINSPGSNLPGAQGFFLGIARATWEVDVWGRIRRTNEAARAQYLATEEARRGGILTLATRRSQTHSALRGARQRRD